MTTLTRPRRRPRRANPAAIDHAARAERYARDVTEGRVLACRWVRLACQRHLDDLARQDRPRFAFRFDAAKANRVCQFIELLPHVKGSWAQRRERISLEDWQCFVVAVPFGWVQKKTGLRRFRRAYIEIPRKNGKSAITAAIGLYSFAADGEHGAEVFSGAGSEKQAWEVFGPARLMAKNTPELCEAFGIGVNAKNLSILATASKFEPVIGKPGDGASPSFSITDEYHEHQTSDQYDTFVTGMGAREQPLAWVITTAGSDTAGPCYQLRTEVANVLEGKARNDQIFGLMYTIDEGVDWASEKALRMANPNMGVSVFEGYLKSQQRDAINSPEKQSTFKTKHLNLWVTAASPYFNAELWARLADRSLSRDQFRGQACWKGLDLAAKLDLTADVSVFQREQPGTCARCRGSGWTRRDAERERDVPAKAGQDGAAECFRCDGSGEHTEPHFYVFGRYYIPEERTHAPDLRRYDGWAKEGHLIATPGNITDYDAVEDGVREDAEVHRIVQLGFDPYNATQIATHMMAEGVECVEIPQNVRNLSEPMKWVQALIVDGRIHHDGNPVLAWAIGNVTAQEDRNGNVFPRKERPENKIDPAVALIIATGRCMEAEQPAESPYESRGFRSIG